MPDRARLQRFCELVGHRNTALLPLTYPQVLAAPLQLALLTSREIPFNPTGIVHVGNRIVLRRPLQATAPLELAVSLSAGDASDRGDELLLETSARDGSGMLRWRAEATLLVRRAAPGSARSRRGSRKPVAPLNEVLSFSVPANTGRRYARVSGDYNPIHLSVPTARLFGFRRAIAHGMWSLARVLSVLSEADAPQQVDVRFCRPLLMPARVALFAGQGESSFALRDQATRKDYLLGALSDPTLWET